MNKKSSFALLLLILSIVSVYMIGCTRTDVENVAYTLYIPNSGEGNISVINAASMEAEQFIIVGETASHGVAVTPDSKYLFTGDLDGGSIYVIDTNVNEIVKTIEVGERTHGIDISPDGKYVLVAAGRGGGPFLAVIDTNLQEVVAVIEDRLSGPTHMSFSPDGKKAYVADPEQNVVVVVNMVDFEVDDVWPTGSEGAQETRISPNGRLLYVANFEGNTLSVLDVSSGDILNIIPAGERTHAVDVSPDGRYVWLVASGSGEVIILDAENGYEAVQTLAFDRPNHVAIPPMGNAVYITDAGKRMLIALDATTYEELGQTPLGESPHEIDFIVRN